MEPGIIPLVVGGLGNQLFITAAAYATSRTHMCPLYIAQNPISNNKHNKYKHNYNDTVFKYVGKHVAHSVHDTHTFHQLGYATHTHHDAYGPWSPSNLRPGRLLSGYYQYYPPLAPFEHDLRGMILQGIDPLRSALGGEQPTAAFLHVRRGDAHENLWLYYLLPIDYYKSCVQQLLAKNPAITTIYIVSDELEWVRQQEFFSNPLFRLFDNDDELATFAFMTNCTGGAICGGSTFSWWAAFLGAYGKRQPVFVPKDWIKTRVYDLFPPEWHIVPSTDNSTNPAI